MNSVDDHGIDNPVQADVDVVYVTKFQADYTWIIITKAIANLKISTD